MWSNTLLTGLFIFTITLTVSAQPSVTTELHHPATLTCDWKCSGVLEWTLFNKPDNVLARCDQTSCRSEKGFNISHDQYLKGNPHFTITAADYSKSGLYTCACNGTDICDVRLFIQSVNFSKVFEPGDSLTVDLPISERVKLVFNRRGDDGTQSSVTLCTVEGHEAHCNPQYEKRTSLRPSLTLTDLKETDSGVYTVWDTDDHQIISTHTLTVTGKNRSCVSEGEQVHCSPVVGLVSMFFTGLVVGILLHRIVLTWIIKRCDRVKRKRAKRSAHDQSTVEVEDDCTKSVQLKSESVDYVSNR